jgi:hypothetical protein
MTFVGFGFGLGLEEEIVKFAPKRSSNSEVADFG